MIERENLEISVANFGPIAKAEIDLRPMTVFAGPSNTGKSYMAILLYALGKTFEMWRASLAVRNLRGAGSFNSLPKESGGAEVEDVELITSWLNEITSHSRIRNLEEDTLIRVPDSISTIIHSKISDFRFLQTNLQHELKRCFSISDIEKLRRHDSYSMTCVNLVNQSVQTSDNGSPLEYQINFDHLDLDITASIPNVMKLQLGKLLMLEKSPVISREAYVDFLCNLAISSQLGILGGPNYYLPADRANIMHAHRAIVSSFFRRASLEELQLDSPLPTLPGVLTDFLLELMEIENEVSELDGSYLAARVEKEILGGAIKTVLSPTGYPLHSYRPDGWIEDIPLTRSSSMVSELAPIVLFLRYLVRPNGLLIIEEPESHLHPQMQVEFIRQLAGVIRSGIHVLLTTHSEWVLEELANMVHLSGIPETDRENFIDTDFALSPGEVGVWLFNQKNDSEGVVVEEIPLDTELGSFPVGFGNVTEYLYNRWVEISNEMEWLRSR